MVEMLGVMAIIGVLSVAWIPAYSIVMNRYRANKILDMASKVAIAAQTINGGRGGCVAVVAQGGVIPGECSEGVPFTDTGLKWYTISGVSGFLADAIADEDEGYVIVHINMPFERIQQAMSAIAGDDYDVDENIIRVKTY